MRQPANSCEEWGAETSGYKAIVFDFTEAAHVDTSAALAIEELIDVASHERPGSYISGLSGTALQYAEEPGCARCGLHPIEFFRPDWRRLPPPGAPSDGVDRIVARCSLRRGWSVRRVVPLLTTRFGYRLQGTSPSQAPPRNRDVTVPSNDPIVSEPRCRTLVCPRACRQRTGSPSIGGTTSRLHATPLTPSIGTECFDSALLRTHQPDRRRRTGPISGHLIRH